MTLQQSPSYWLTCDGTLDDGSTCNANSTEGADYSGWGEIDQAREDADQSDWAHHDGKDYCEAHSYQFRCDDCGEPADSSQCVCEADRGEIAEGVTP